MPILSPDPLLQQVDLFHGMSEENLADLAGLLSRRAVAAGTTLMSLEQPGSALYVVAAGWVKVFLNRDDGTEVIVALVGPGQTVGEMNVFLDDSRTANAVTMERCTLLCMSGQDFGACLTRMPRLGYNLNRLLSQRLRLANQQILALSSLDVAGRVAREILAFAEQYGRDENHGRVRIPLRLTQGDLAAFIGTSRERVNQVMVRFKRRGYLSVDRAYHIIVHDREALARRCGWVPALA